MDTRTPRRPTLGGTAGIDSESGLNTVKVPSDPAKLSSTQASFRVRLAAPVAPMLTPSAGAAFGDPYGIRGHGTRESESGVEVYGTRPLITPQVVVPSIQVPALAGAGGAAPRRKPRLVTWSGQAAPGDVAATLLLEAVRLNTVPAPGGVGGAGGAAGEDETQPLDLLTPGQSGQPLQAVPRQSAPTDPYAADPYATDTYAADPYAGDLYATDRYGDVGHAGAPYGTDSAGVALAGSAVSGAAAYGAPAAGAAVGAAGGSGAVAASDERPYVGYSDALRGGGSWAPSGELPEVSSEAAGYARYPGRRVDLGLVLLPLRVLLGSLSVYAGFSKLCDPVYFDGGDRGSMVRWLSSLHPWRVAEPLLHFAMAHPVGAGLSVAFIQIVVGVLTVLGLWQRLAAGTAMLLSAALLFTVGWRAVPVYDTPDLIFLVAWSPLLIAGAPFGSLDGRIALEAWRRYGYDDPDAVRRRVLRRGAVVTAVVVGLTLLTGSTLGAAVRTGRPQPVAPPADYGPPRWPSTLPNPSTTPSPSTSHSPSPSPSAPGSGKPSGSPSGSGSGAPKPSPDVSGSSHAPGSGASGSSGGPGGTTSRPSPSGGSGLIGGVLGSGPLLDWSDQGTRRGSTADRSA